MRKPRPVLFGFACTLSAAVCGQTPAPGEHISFVSCPVVRDTRTVPCWISDYEGKTYYLTIQSDVSAIVQPPLLGHQVLVEGVVSSAPEICGGIVLEQTRLSVMPELDANCNTMLPAEDRYPIDFNPRPPGPSGGRLAFDPDPNARVTAPAKEEPAALTGPQTVTLYFDFDRTVSFRHPAALVSILELAEKIHATRMHVEGVRGAHLLSNGRLLQEAGYMGKKRAEEIAGLLTGAGLQVTTELSWTDATTEADGVDDWQSRRVTLTLLP